LFLSSGTRPMPFCCSSVKMKTSRIMHPFISNGLVLVSLHTRSIMWLGSIISP
ncbi:hypothetical protein FRB90_003016, partial [Tulasnella sp. 427]